MIPDLLGKGNRTRTVTVPAGVKARIDLWTKTAGITAGPIFRPVTKAGLVKQSVILDEKVVWRLVVRYARETELGKLAPHDLRRTCAKLCRKAGGDLEPIQLLLGHASVQTTERYPGTEQQLAQAVNDGLGLGPRVISPRARACGSEGREPQECVAAPQSRSAPQRASFVWPPSTRRRYWPRNQFRIAMVWNRGARLGASMNHPRRQT